jgi:hypothetical protein
MTTVATRMAEIKLVEEFDVAFLHEDDSPVDVKENGLPRFDFERRMKGTATVQEWRTQRFARIYPTKKCVVLYADGREVVGQTTLAAVRATYEEP